MDFQTAAPNHICKLSNSGSYVHHILLFIHVRPAKQPTKTGVALCRETFRDPYTKTLS